MAELLPAGTTLANSADIPIAAGGSVTLYIKGAPGITTLPFDCNFYVQHKTSGGDYVTLFALNARNINEEGVVTGVGTFRVQRQACTVPSGMDMEQ